MMATQYTITGVIEGSDGSRSEFMMLATNGGWTQWGPIAKEQFGERVDFLDAMQRGLAEDTDYFDQAPEDDEPEESDADEEAGE
jgi:hypothetical protein